MNSKSLLIHAMQIKSREPPFFTQRTSQFVERRTALRDCSHRYRTAQSVLKFPLNASSAMFSLFRLLQPRAADRPPRRTAAGDDTRRLFFFGFVANCFGIQSYPPRPGSYVPVVASYLILDHATLSGCLLLFYNLHVDSAKMFSLGMSS